MTEPQIDQTVQKMKKEKKEKKIKKLKRKAETEGNTVDVVPPSTRGDEEGPQKKKKKYFRDKEKKEKTREEPKEEKEDKKKERKEKKFSMKLNMGEKVEEISSVSTSGSGKGPRIIIAKEKTTETQEKLSKRKQKKQKKEGTIINVEDSVGRTKSLAYLKTWVQDRENWKFHKCRQIWLLKFAYDTCRVPDSNFPDLVQYIGSIKGGMRELALSTAKSTVATYIKWEELLSTKTEEEVLAVVGKPRVSEAASDRALQILEILKCEN